MDFASELNAADASTISIQHTWSPRVDWVELFRLLTEVFQPSYAMLHLFTEAEVAASAGRDRFDVFDGPVTGERSFTSWKSILADWRFPDHFDLAARRRYRFLPELAWANWLGPEFDGQYDKAFLQANAASPVPMARGFAFQITQDLRDIEQHPAAFSDARAKLKSAFASGFFRN